ncbi:hypothetical protein A4A49_60826, partial [Nicotiana attenuata]
TVHILDALQTNDVPLNLQCQSKDDDFGIKTPKVGDDFHLNVFGSTRFYCHFWLGNYGSAKTQFFDVFNKQISQGCGRINGNGNDYECFWRVQEDGFFFAPHNPYSYTKKYDW